MCKSKCNQQKTNNITERPEDERKKLTTMKFHSSMNRPKDLLVIFDFLPFASQNFLN